MAEAPTAAEEGTTPLAPLRVCLVLPAATRGGAEVWLERVVEHSERMTVEVVALAEGDAAAAWRGRGARVTVIPAGSRTKGATGAVLRLAAYLRRSRPDLVVAPGVKAGLLSGLAGHLSGTRTVWVRVDDSFEGRMVDLADRVTDGSLSVIDRLLQGRRRPGIEATPPLPGTPLSRRDACRELGLEPQGDLLRLVMLSRLIPYKGIDDAIAALATAEDWELHVYGIEDAAHPGERERLLTRAAELGVADRTHLHPPADGMGERLAAFDAVAMLTRDDPDASVTGEGYGNTAHEGMRCGTPVISTGPLDVHLGDAALSVPDGDPAAIADALGRLSDPALRARLGASGRAHDDDVHASTGMPAIESYLAQTAERVGAGLRGEAPITVVTTVLNEADGLDELVRALRPQLGPEDELLVVDGGSRDGTLDVAHGHAIADTRVTVVETDGAGISEGRNIGIGRAQHELVACTDVGCDPAPGWLTAIRAAAADQPGTALLTGVYAVTSTSPLQEALAVTGYPVVAELTHPTPATRLYGRLFGRAFDPTMPTGRSVAVTRQAWREVGGFPEHLATGEDVTFGRAVAQRHPSTLVSDALVTWEQRPTLRSTLKMYYRYGLGSGHSRDPRLLARDGARAVAYLAGGALLARGGTAGRVLGAAGAAAYLSVPVARALRGTYGLQGAALVPAVTVLRDGAKVVGALVGLRQGPPETAATTTPTGAASDA